MLLRQLKKSMSNNFLMLKRANLSYLVEGRLADYKPCQTCLFLECCSSATLAHRVASHSILAFQMCMVHHACNCTQNFPHIDRTNFHLNRCHDSCNLTNPNTRYKIQNRPLDGVISPVHTSQLNEAGVIIAALLLSVAPLIVRSICTLFNNPAVPIVWK